LLQVEGQTLTEPGPVSRSTDRRRGRVGIVGRSSDVERGHGRQPRDRGRRAAQELRGVQALCGVDLSIEAGIVYGLLGPNGAGKTTAVRILTTLLPLDEGQARVAGFDVVTEGPQVRERIGLAGQYAAVDENLTGFENLEMVGRLYHLGRRFSRGRADELLAAFDLSEAGGRLVRTYSGGMRRRLDLAAALVAKPPVLFLDEPTTGLDLRSRIGLWDAIEALVSEGTTVLLTTQYLDEADRLADRIAVIDRGVVIAEGTSDELKSQIGGDRLEIRLDDGARREGTLAALAPVADGRPYFEDGALRLPLQRQRGEIAEAVRRLDRGRDRDRGHRRRAPDARRRLPAADRARRGARRGGG
jgi:ABC-2 type transport system ATP-binding protein